jgi:nicotinamide riboside transporter PnuC
MSPFTITLIEWGSTLLSLAGFWLCIRHRASCFLVFLAADLGWFVSAWAQAHGSLIAQQVVYIVLNVVGFVLWRRDERLNAELDQVEQRAIILPTEDEMGEADLVPG